MKFIWVYVTTANKKEAQKIADALLDKHLIACANIFPAIESRYCWKGKTVRSKEIAMVMKTTSKNFKKIEREILKIHSYEVPCIISIPWSQGYRPFLKWLLQSI